MAENFPDVVIHAGLPARNSHPGLDSAKAGYIDAALRLVQAFLNPDALQSMQEIVGGRQPLIVPFSAIEFTGFNAIPDTMAQVLFERLGLPLFAGGIVQFNKVAHTRSNGWHCLVTPATFTGALEAGADYLLVDD